MGVTAITLAVAYAFVCSYVYLEPTLPTVAAMKNNELAVPLRVYTRSGELIAQIGEQRRNPVKYEQIPLIVRQTPSSPPKTTVSSSITASTGRASCARCSSTSTSGESQGASTITMQAARSAFFTQEQTVRRKLQEIFVTHRLEQRIHQAGNPRAVSQRDLLRPALVRRGRGGRNLLRQAARSSSRSAKPRRWRACRSGRRASTRSRNPAGAAERRGYVLRRMRELGYIDAAAGRRGLARSS